MMKHKVGDYNTQREPLVLKEYGRNVQMLVKYLNTIGDKEKRTLSARTLIELMKQINPSVKEIMEDSQKLWDDLIIMSDFVLDINSPFPKPERSILYRKPHSIPYHNRDIMYKHYGLNIQLLVERCVSIENDEDREVAVIHIGRLIKSFSNLWNKEILDDQSVINNIEHLSKGKLTIDIQKVKEFNLFDSFIRERPRNNNGGGGTYRHKKGKRKRN